MRVARSRYLPMIIIIIIFILFLSHMHASRLLFMPGHNANLLDGLMHNAIHHFSLSTQSFPLHVQQGSSREREEICIRYKKKKKRKEESLQKMKPKF